MRQVLNQPAISDAAAMREFPHARDAERDALLDSVELRPGMRVADIQAAGGYLSEGVYGRLAGQVECLCIEPVKALRSRLDPAFIRIEDPIDRLDSIDTGSVDVVLGLAGLHHSPSKDGTIAEVFRILKPGGAFAVCDVIDGSPVARWLNDYVNRHNPLGHRGCFLDSGELSRRMARAGFLGIREEIRSVPWIFPTDLDVARFFKGLFGLATDVSQVRDAIPRYLDLRREAGRVLVDWRLIYGRGTKPAV